MRLLLRRLWNEELGAVVSAEIMLIGTILVLGMIVGLKSVRDSAVTELADVAQGISNLSQSFYYSGTNATTVSGSTARSGSASSPLMAGSGTVTTCINVGSSGGNES